MKKEYYKLPLDCRGFFEKGSFKKCNELESIDQQINLMLTTYPGEHHFDDKYGCRICELDFKNVESAEVWEKMFREYILNSITTYEKRLTDVVLELELMDVVKDDRTSYSISVRKRVDVYVKALLVSTGDRISLGYSLFLGPLSSE